MERASCRSIILALVVDDDGDVGTGRVTLNRWLGRVLVMDFVE